MSDGPPGALPPLAGTALAVTAIALALGTFMQVLDGTIANVSIPTIAGNLSVSPDQGTWVITSFAVANGVSVPRRRSKTGHGSNRSPRTRRTPTS